MRVLFEVTHPAHVHLFRHPIQELQERGEEVYVAAREKDITTDLLDHYGIEYTVLSSQKGGIISLSLEWAIREIRTVQFYRSVEPDIVVSRFNPAAATVSSLLQIPHLVFEDTEINPRPVRWFGDTFSDNIYTPECFERNLGESQIRYDGYHELAYLHPNHFEPDPSVLDEEQIDTEEPLVIIRLVAWDAIHDVGDSGLDSVLDVVEELEAAGVTVRITSERELPSEVSDRVVSISPHRIHHLMANANLYIGESATMATESAVLGTPAVLISSNTRGYTNELEDKYGLVFNFSGADRHQKGIDKARELLADFDGDEWERKREVLLAEKTDTAKFISDEIYSQHPVGSK